MPEKSINTYIYIIYKKFGKESLQKKSVTFFRLEGGGVRTAHLPARSKVNILTSIEVSYMVETVMNSRFQK